MSPSVEPFNESKYKALMDGLECNEIYLRYVEDRLLRFDAEYYQKTNLAIEKALNSMNGNTISAYNGKTDCSAFYPSITGYYNYNRDNIPFLRVNEIVDGLVLISDKTVFLPEDIIKENSKTIALAYPGDIIIAKGGNTLAKVGLVTDEYDVYATCRDVIILRTNDILKINKFYLWAYLHGFYGQKLMWRSASQTGQPHLTLKSIDNIHVPEYSSFIQQNVESLYNQSVSLKINARKKYEQAVAVLTCTLNIGSIINQAISIKNFSVSFGITGRLDAEYYQPRYENYAASLCTSETVASLCNIYDKNFTPNNDSSYKYIELAHVGTSGEISGVETICGKDLPTRARRKVKAGQVIISSVEGSLQSCALITDEYDGALCSTGFYVLDSDSINSETLLVLFKSEPIQALIKQRCSGTILTAISKDELLSMPLPKIDNDVQKGIAVKVQESFALRQKSKQLLEYAKQAVEMAIEQGEEIALEWLKGKVDE